MSNPGGWLNVRFPAQSAPASASCIARGGIEGGVVVTNVSFRLMLDGPLPSALRLYIHALPAGRHWYRRLALPPAGVWTDYAIPVDYAEGWTTGPCRSGPAFAQDATVMNWVGLYVRRGGIRAEQSVRIDDFRIAGVRDYTIDRDADLMPDYWEAKYGLNADVDDAAANGDNDEMDNLGEYAADTRPDDGDSVLAITSLADVGGELVLEWKGGTAATQYVEWTPALTHAWLAIFTNPPPTLTHNLPLSFPGPVNFFRLRAERP